MIAGLVVVAFGFTFMAIDKEQFGWLGLTLGPIVVVAGFVTEIAAIMHTPKEKQ